VIDSGNGPTPKQQRATRDALPHTKEANSHGQEVTHGDHDDGRREGHRRAPGRQNWRSKVVE
jgi:hypothetical protein